jgi:hypothetical protein
MYRAKRYARTDETWDTVIQGRGGAQRKEDCDTVPRRAHRQATAMGGRCRMLRVDRHALERWTGSSRMLTHMIKYMSYKCLKLGVRRRLQVVVRSFPLPDSAKVVLVHQGYRLLHFLPQPLGLPIA